MKEDFNRLFPDNRMDNLDEEPLRQAQLIAVRILKIVDHVCRKHGIGYWIDGGTLLGAVRNGKFIPWDDDIDIGMTREDYEKFLSIAVEELPDDLFVQNYSTTELAGTTWTQIKDRKSYIKIDNGANDHEGIFIDIFPFDSYSEDSIKRFREMMYKTLYIKAFAVNAPLKKPYFQGINLAKNIAKILLKIVFFEFAIFDKNYIYKKNLKTREKRIEALKGNPKTNYGYGTDVLNWDFVYKAEHVLPL
jgi:lipopolysaccharide cholinephosphotransferase